MSNKATPISNLQPQGQPDMGQPQIDNLEEVMQELDQSEQQMYNVQTQQMIPPQQQQQMMMPPQQQQMMMPPQQQQMMMPPMMMPPPPIVPDPYGSEFIPGPGAPGDDYYQYEPTQDSQWQSQVE